MTSSCSHKVWCSKCLPLYAWSLNARRQLKLLNVNWKRISPKCNHRLISASGITCFGSITSNKLSNVRYKEGFQMPNFDVDTTPRSGENWRGNDLLCRLQFHDVLFSILLQPVVALTQYRHLTAGCRGLVTRRRSVVIATIRLRELWYAGKKRGMGLGSTALRVSCWRIWIH